MKRKDIEKAAGDYSGSILECEGSSVTVKRQSFIDGAEWRINSIWHNREEEADLTKDIIVMYKDGSCMLISWGNSWDLLLSVNMFVKWAYVEDLLPNIEE